MDKQALRSDLLRTRQALNEAAHRLLSTRAQAALIASPWWVAARLVLLYQPFRGEVGTEMLAASAVAAGKRLALPRVQKAPRRLWLHRYGGDPLTLVEGPYGLLEPRVDWPLVEYGAVDLVVVPGVAFTLAGMRLGYGGGYYDRALAELRAARATTRAVGLAFDLQVVSDLPTDPHDMRVDGVCTESGFVTVR